MGILMQLFPCDKQRCFTWIQDHQSALYQADKFMPQSLSIIELNLGRTTHQRITMTGAWPVYIIGC